MLILTLYTVALEGLSQDDLPYGFISLRWPQHGREGLNWGPLGGLLGLLGASWGPLGDLLGASWGPLGSIWRRPGGVSEQRLR